MFLFRIVSTIILLCFTFGLNAQNLQQEQRELRRKYNNPYEQTGKTKTVQVFKLRGYNDSTQLLFSALATCRMTCNSLDEAAIRKVLKEGLVNVRRSDLESEQKTFAVEDDPGKKLRVVVEPQGNALLVVTVYPIEKKMTCDCKNK